MSTSIPYDHPFVKRTRVKAKFGIAELVRSFTTSSTTFFARGWKLLFLTPIFRLKVDQLIKPVQRIPRYTLLLKELRKNTEEEVAAVSLDSAILALEDVSRKSEIVIEDAEGVTKLLDLQTQSDVNVLDVGHRRLLFKTVSTVTATSKAFRRPRDRVLVVCNDVIFVFKREMSPTMNLEKLKLRKKIPMNECFIYGVSMHGAFRIHQRPEERSAKLNCVTHYRLH